MECIPQHFHFVNINMTWAEAQHYCRENYTDLAAIDNMEDMKRLLDVNHDGYEGKAWIGLHQTAVSSWKWSLAVEGFYGLEETNFTKWGKKQPDNSYENCADMTKNGQWFDKTCHTKHTFVCYNGENCYRSIKCYSIAF